MGAGDNTDNDENNTNSFHSDNRREVDLSETYLQLTILR